MLSNNARLVARIFRHPPVVLLTSCASSNIQVRYLSNRRRGTSEYAGKGHSNQRRNPTPNASEPLDSHLQLSGSEVQKAFDPELQRLMMHSALLKQTDVDGLLLLADVEPMMAICFSLLDRRVLEPHSILAVTESLRQTAKDASRLLAKIPRTERSALNASIHGRLQKYAEILSEKLVMGPGFDSLIPSYLNLMLLFQKISPKSGIYLFEQLREPSSLAAAAILCLAEAGATMDSVCEVFMRSDQNDHTKAAMVNVYLKRGYIQEALDMEKTISPNAPTAIKNQLIDNFIGHSPPELALKYFHQSVEAPHPATMTRFLNNLWLRTGNFEQLVSIQSEYLAKLNKSDEVVFKTVTWAVVDALVKSVETEDSLETILHKIRLLTKAYPVARHEVLLNIIVTRFSKSLPKRTEIIKLLFQEYSDPPSSLVACRVRLNALKNFSRTEAEIFGEKFWNQRLMFPDPITNIDRLALKNANRD